MSDAEVREWERRWRAQGDSAAELYGSHLLRTGRFPNTFDWLDALLLEHPDSASELYVKKGRPYIHIQSDSILLRNVEHRNEKWKFCWKTKQEEGSRRINEWRDNFRKLQYKLADVAEYISTFKMLEKMQTGPQGELVHTLINDIFAPELQENDGHTVTATIASVRMIQQSDGAPAQPNYHLLHNAGRRSQEHAEMNYLIENASLDANGGYLHELDKSSKKLIQELTHGNAEDLDNIMRNLLGCQTSLQNGAVLPISQVFIRRHKEFTLAIYPPQLSGTARGIRTEKE